MYHLTLPDRLNRAWKTGIGKGSDNYARLIAEPVVADGTLYTIDTIAKVTAIDAANGRVRWSNRLEMKGEKRRSRLVADSQFTMERYTRPPAMALSLLSTPQPELNSGVGI